MNKNEIYKLLENLHIWYEVTEHKAVHNMEEVSHIDLPYPEADAKNLFVRDDKKRQYYLITVKGHKKINLKTFKHDNHTRPLSFASKEDLMNILKLTPGSVTPFGLLNDRDCQVQFFIDEEFISSPEIIGVHPNDNRATVWLKTRDFIKMIEKHGNTVHIVNIE